MVGQESPVTFATTKLSYPIFDAEFDPYNRGFLVVAGGGGENRTGVPNKITLLDVSSRASVFEVADINLSTDEDSPQSLASLTTKKGLIAFVGVSSSVSDQKNGHNEHFRSYDVEFPPKKRVKRDGEASEAKGEKSKAKITLAGKSSLFTPPTSSKSKVYQRLLCLSPVKSRDVAAKRIGAIAAADASENEIVIFDATTFMPNASSILARIDTTVEAEDLDLFERSEGTFSLAYCTNHDVFIHSITCDFSAKTSKVSAKTSDTAFSVPKYGSKRPRLRSLRWISPQHVILLQNSSPGGGPELIALRIADNKAFVIQRHRLSLSMGIAVRLDVCCLDPDPVTGTRQIVVAAAGQDQSIHILTCNHEPAQTDTKLQISKLKPFSVLDTSRQHPQSISKICFSKFFPPSQPEKSNMSVEQEPQYIHLASVSLGYTVSVEALALTAVPTSPSSTPDVSSKKKTPSVRWILSTTGSEFLRSWYVYGLVAVIVLVASLLLQNYMSHTLEATRQTLPKTVEVNAGKNPSSAAGSMGANTVQVTSSPIAVVSEPAPHGRHHLRDLFSRHRDDLATDHTQGDGASSSKKAIHVVLGSENPHSKDVSASVHDNVEALRSAGAKKFDELEDHEKELWKKRLSEAGHWSAEEGETVLKSILFSQWAEIVGGALRDAVLQN